MWSDLRDSRMYPEGSLCHSYKNTKDNLCLKIVLYQMVNIPSSTVSMEDKSAKLWQFLFILFPPKINLRIADIWLFPNSACTEMQLTWNIIENMKSF